MSKYRWHEVVARDEDRLLKARSESDRIVVVEYRTFHYRVIRTKDQQMIVVLFGRLVKKPPAIVLKKATAIMSSLDVSDVHGL